MGIIKTTYEVVSPESAEDGEVESRGFIDEVGTSYTVDEAIDLLAGFEPSASYFHPGIWYSGDPDTDFRTGKEETISYPLSGFTEDEERHIYKGVRE